MGKAQPAGQPSIDELLASIRQAIHDEVEPAMRSTAADRSGAAERRSAVTGSMRSLRVSLEPGGVGKGRLTARTDDFLALQDRLGGPASTAEGVKRTIVTSDKEGFAGLLGGDVRLEEALARLSEAGRRTAAEAGARPVLTIVPPAPPAGPKLRPAVDDDSETGVTRGDASPSGERVLAAQNGMSPAPDQSGRARLPPATSDPQWSADGTAERQPYTSVRSPVDQGPGRGADRIEPERAAVSLWDESQRWSGGERNPAGELPEGPFEPPPSRTRPELLSAEAASAAASAFNRLADTIVARSSAGERSIEDITRELLRPMLKSWLDENLPRIVERLVREEIERVARRGGK